MPRDPFCVGKRRAARRSVWECWSSVVSGDLSVLAVDLLLSPFRYLNGREHGPRRSSSRTATWYGTGVHGSHGFAGSTRLHGPRASCADAVVVGHGVPPVRPRYLGSVTWARACLRGREGNGPGRARRVDVMVCASGPCIRRTGTRRPCARCVHGSTRGPGTHGPSGCHG